MACVCRSAPTSPTQSRLGGSAAPSPLRARPPATGSSIQSPINVPLRVRDLSANFNDPEEAPHLLVNSRAPQHVENDVWRGCLESCTHAHTHVYVNTHTQARVCPHTHPHIQPHRLTRTHIHTCTAHRHKRTRAHQ